MSRSTLTALVVVAIVAVGIGGYLAYDTFLRGDAVPALALPSSSPEAGASTEPSTEASTEPSAAASDATDPSASADAGSGDLAGVWTVAAAEAGYRVREQLANLPAESDAVGRTDAVTGSITLAGDGDAVQLTEGSLEVDTTTIASDEGRRDNRMRSEGLETDAFPTATFVITQPLDVPAAALAGTATDITLVGDLTLHGVTQSVEIPAQAQLVDGQVQVAGSYTFPLSDFDIVAPNVGGFIVSIADEGALEFLVAFAKG